MMSVKSISFNYIITIHNKENLIRDVMLGVIDSAGVNSSIYPVLDGCTDLSEYIIDDLIKTYPTVKIIKLYANDVHELKSINIGLNHSCQIGEGYNIILQDDVILADADLEMKCIHLYQTFPELGMLSFRHGGNLSREQIYLDYVFMPYDDFIQSQWGHLPYNKPILKTGYFTFKEIVIKSPICIPFSIIREIGIPNEIYAPWDDIAYSYGVSTAGYANGILAIKYFSEVDWGTTRTKEQELNPGVIMHKNLVTFRSRNPNIPPLDRIKYDNKKYQIFNGH